MARKFKKKDKFEDLDPAFQSEVSVMKTEEINAKIAQWAKEAELQTVAMKNDEDLAQKKEAVKFAAEPYRDAIKGARLRIAFGMRVLTDRGAE